MKMRKGEIKSVHGQNDLREMICDQQNKTR